MKRHEFVKLGMNNPKKAAELLKKKACQLEQAKRVDDIAKALSETVFISDRTVYRDCKK